MITGSIVAIVTPMHEDGSLDLPNLRRLIDFHVAEGTDGIVIVGTTGESPTVNMEEHCELIRAAVDHAAGRIPVIAGTGGNSTREAVELTSYARQAGAVAGLSVVPYYNKPTQEGLYRHFKAISEAADIPIFVYNVPVRTIVDIQVPTMARCAQLKNVVGVKDATANVGRVTQQRLTCGKNFIQMSGEDSTALGFMAHGGQGCISVTANVAPRLCAQFQNACLKGDWATALELQDKLMPLHDALFVETNPAPVKYAAWRLGVIGSPDCRLPLAPLADSTKKAVDDVLARIGLLQAKAAE
jgi:4-hydroxy-tetrahydrodipicolinate synthase